MNSSPGDQNEVAVARDRKQLKFLTGLSSRRSQISMGALHTSSQGEISGLRDTKKTPKNVKVVGRDSIRGFKMIGSLNKGKSQTSQKMSLSGTKGHQDISTKKEGVDSGQDTAPERNFNEKSLEFPDARLVPNGLLKPKEPSLTPSVLGFEEFPGRFQKSKGFSSARRSFWINRLAIPSIHLGKTEGDFLRKASSTKDLTRPFRTTSSNFSETNRAGVDRGFNDENEIIKEQDESQIICQNEEHELNELEKVEVHNLENWVAIKKNEAVINKNYMESKKNQISSAYIDRYLHPVDPELDSNLISSIMDPPVNGRTFLAQNQGDTSKKLVSLQVVEHIKDYKKYLRDLAGPAGTLMGKRSQPQKTPDAVRADLNRFILNDLVGRKLKMEIDQGEFVNAGGLGLVMGGGIDRLARRNRNSESGAITSSLMVNEGLQTSQNSAKVEMTKEPKVKMTIVKGQVEIKAKIQREEQKTMEKIQMQFKDKSQREAEESPKSTLPVLTSEQKTAGTKREMESKTMSELSQRIAVSGPALRIASETLSGFKCFQQLQAGQTKAGSTDLSIEYLLWVIKNKNGMELSDEFKFSEQYKVYLSRKSTDSSTQLSLKGLEVHLRMQLEDNLYETEKKREELMFTENEKYKKTQIFNKQRGIVTQTPHAFSLLMLLYFQWVWTSSVVR